MQTIEYDLSLYIDEIARADTAIAALAFLDDPGLGHGRPLGATLVKMIDECALQSGSVRFDFPTTTVRLKSTGWATPRAKPALDDW